MPGRGADEEARQAAWARLWPAWRNLPEWEERADAEFGAELGEDMLVLWALLRFGGSPDLEGLLKELVTDDLEPTFGGTLMQDIVQVAFALGAAWAASEHAAEQALRPADGDDESDMPGIPHVVHY